MNSGLKTVKIKEAYFQGQVSLEKGKDWIKPWRLPYRELKLFPSQVEMLMEKAEQPAGVRLRIETDSPTVIVVVAAYSQKAQAFDLTINNRLVDSQVIAPKHGKVVFTNLPRRKKVVEIWFSTTTPVKVKAIQVEKASTCLPAKDTRKRWITYGSSISHSIAGYSPARTWPAIAAREKNLHLTCLGYGGQCHIDSMFARLISNLPADLITLKLGVNVYMDSSLNYRTFMPAIIGMVMLIRQWHKKTPIVLISPVFSPIGETTKNKAGLTLEMMRDYHKEAYKRLRSATGDQNLYQVNGLKLFSAADGEKYLPDDRHPSAKGYEILGKNFVQQVLNKVKY